jgi:hypothetical protein
MRVFLISIAVLLLAAAAAAETGVSLTVYNDNLALVRDVRPMSFKNGADEILFRDVAAQIDPTSVHFKAAGVDMLEQNFDYDLVSPEKLLQKYVDQTIEVVAKNGDVVRGTLMTATGGQTGQFVLKQSDGSLRSILMENAAEIRYPNLPDGLITKPTLRWLVKSNAEGKKETEVSYLTSGISWRADYVLLLNEANTRADVDAWVTLDNKCGADYKSARLKLIAGEIHRAKQPPRGGMNERAVSMMAMKADVGFEERSFFEYHLYTLQRLTDVLDRQTKQVSLFPSTSASIKKVYTYDWQQDNDNVAVSAEFENKETNGLGMALPAGRVRVYQGNPDGGQEFIGEDNIEHTPKNEKVTVTIGKAFDIAAERASKDRRRISDRIWEEDIEVKVRNHKKETIDVIVTDSWGGFWEIMKESLLHKKINASRIEYTVSVAPENEIVLTYTVRHE